MRAVFTERAALGAAIVSLAVAAGVAGCGSGSKSGSAAAPMHASVTIKSYEFKPATVRVKAGGSISWKNLDGTEHTATANDNRSFDSGTIKADGKTATVTFKKAGRFAYHCAFHAYMQGTVVVAP